MLDDNEDYEKIPSKIWQIRYKSRWFCWIPKAWNSLIEVLKKQRLNSRAFWFTLELSIDYTPSYFSYTPRISSVFFNFSSILVNFISQFNALLHLTRWSDSFRRNKTSFDEWVKQISNYLFRTCQFTRFRIPFILNICNVLSIPGATSYPEFDEHQGSLCPLFTLI